MKDQKDIIMRSMWTFWQYSLVLIVFCALHYKDAEAQQSWTRQVEEEVKPAELLSISTSSANWKIHTWDKPVTRIIVNGMVELKDMEDSTELLGKLAPRITRKDGKVSLEAIGDIKCFITRYMGLKKKTTIKFEDGSKYAVVDFEYSVEAYIPSKNPIDIDASFAELSLGDRVGTASLSLSSSTLKAGDLNELSIDASFSKIQLNNVRKADVALASTTLKGSKIEVLNLSSSFSETTIDELEELSLKSSSDEIELGRLAEISGSTAFTDLNIGILESKLQMESSSGDVSIQLLKSGFSTLDFRGSFLDLAINVDPQASYRVESSVTFSDLVLPPSSYSKGKKIRQDGPSSKFQGQFGSEASTASVIKFDCSSCDIVVK